MTPTQAKEFNHTVMVVAVLAGIGTLTIGVGLLWLAWWVWLNFPEWAP